MKVPKSLKIWFLIHFLVDMIFAIPLMIAPAWTLGLFGFTGVETLTARLVGAALIGIGGASFFTRNKGIESYEILLTLKLLWSWSAIVALALAVIEGAPIAVWFILLIFVCFSALWGYYKFVRLHAH